MRWVFVLPLICDQMWNKEDYRPRNAHLSLFTTYMRLWTMQRLFCQRKKTHLYKICSIFFWGSDVINSFCTNISVIHLKLMDLFIVLRVLIRALASLCLMITILYWIQPWPSICLHDAAFTLLGLEEPFILIICSEYISCNIILWLHLTYFRCKVHLLESEHSSKFSFHWYLKLEGWCR